MPVIPQTDRGHQPKRGDDAWWMWVSLSAASLVVIGAVFFVGGLHFLLRIPADELLRPYAAYCVLTVIFVPAFRFFRRRWLTSGDVRPLIASAVAYSVLGCAVIVHYGIRAGILSRDHQTGYYVVLAIVALVGLATGFARQRFAKPRIPE